MFAKIIHGKTSKDFSYAFNSDLEGIYLMVFHVIDVNHLITEFALANIPATVSLMKINFFNGKFLVTITALLCL